MTFTAFSSRGITIFIALVSFQGCDEGGAEQSHAPKGRLKEEAC